MPRLIKIRTPKRTRILSEYARPITMVAILLGLLCLFLLINIQPQNGHRESKRNRSERKKRREMELVPVAIPMKRPDVNTSEEEKTERHLIPSISSDQRYAAMLAKVKDQRRLGEVKEPYYYVLSKVQSMTNIEIDRQVNHSITYADIARDPNSVRGEIMRVAGTLMKLKPIHLKQPPPNITTIYEGHIVDSELHHYIIVLTDTPKTKFRIGHDVVRLNGVFFMVKAYKTVGGWWKAVPFVIGKRLVKVKRKETDINMNLVTIMMLVVIVGATILTIVRIFWVNKNTASIIARHRGRKLDAQVDQGIENDGTNGDDLK